MEILFTLSLLEENIVRSMPVRVKYNFAQYFFDINYVIL